MAETASIQDKIRSWQVAAPGLEGSSASAARQSKKVELIIKSDSETEGRRRAAGIRVHRPPPLSGSPTSPTKSTTRSTEIDLEKRAWVRRRAPASNADSDSDIKRATMPSKRVVSDSRWRKDASIPNSTVKTSSSPASASATRDRPKRVIVQKSVPNLRQPSVKSRPYMTRTTRSRSRLTGPIDSRDDVTPEKAYMTRSQHSADHSITSSPTPRTTALSSVKSLSQLPSITSQVRQTLYDTPTAAPIALAEGSPPLKRSYPPSTRLSPHYARISPSAPASVPTSVPTAYTATSVNPDDSISRVGLRPQQKPRQRSKTFMQQLFGDGDAKNKSKENMSPVLEQRPQPTPQTTGGRIDSWLNETDDPLEERPDRVHRPTVVSTVSDPLSSPKSAKRTQRYAGPDSSAPPTANWSDPRPRKSSATFRRPSANTVTSHDSSPSVDPERAYTIRTFKKVRNPVLSRIETSNNSREAGSYTETMTTTAADSLLHDEPLSTIYSMSERQSATHLSDTSRLTSKLGTERTLPTKLDRKASRSSRRRLCRTTTHDDLISVLSLPQDEAPTLMSAASVHRRSLSKSPVFDEILEDLEQDELKYRRELRTLVKGVIPALSAYKARGHIPDSTVSSDSSFQASIPPIADIGRALDRLWDQHDRIPLDHAKNLIAWAQDTISLYVSYLDVWRMGFDDVTVNLGPANYDGVMSSTCDSDMTAEGDRVDVEYLLKRPLIRLKTLARTLQDLDDADSTLDAEGVAREYHDLVSIARDRSNEERARIEDEAAAAIDPTRARDLYSLSPMAGVEIDPTRVVRARDYFDMTLRHSTGQVLDCRVEVLLRDDSKDSSRGDVLICEVSDLGRWLLFPPVPRRRAGVTATEFAGQAILTLRGYTQSDHAPWVESMMLRSSETEVCEQWIDMLGGMSDTPLMLGSEFNSQYTGASDNPPPVPVHRHSVVSRDTPSAPGLDVPLGERVGQAKRWRDAFGAAAAGGLAYVASKAGPQQSAGRDLKQRPRDADLGSEATGSDGFTDPSLLSSQSSDLPLRRDYGPARAPQVHSALDRDHDAKSHHASSVGSEYDTQGESQERDRVMPKSPKRKPVPTSRSELPKQSYFDLDFETGASHDNEPLSAPAKMQGRSPPKLQCSTSPSPSPSPSSSLSPSPTANRPKPRLGFFPAFKSNLFKRRRPSSPLKHEYAPSTKSASDLGSDTSVDDESSSQDEWDDKLSPINVRKRGGQRLGSVLVKVPVPVSLPSSASSQQLAQHPPRSESLNQSRPLPRPQSRPRTPSQQNRTNHAIASISSWSQSGRWEKLVEEDVKIVVSPGLLQAFDQSDGRSLQSSSSSIGTSSSAPGAQPLISLELTPLVPIRRGTALDISIRSGGDKSGHGPVPEVSRLKHGNNVLLRSRSPEECEALYGFINQARIDNAAFKAMQTAPAAGLAPGPRTDGAGEQNRVAVPVDHWTMGTRRASRTASWFGGSSGGGASGPRRAGSYRNKSARSTSASTRSSAGNWTSALRRFSQSSNKHDNGTGSSYGLGNGPGPGTGHRISSNKLFGGLAAAARAGLSTSSRSGDVRTTSWSNSNSNSNSNSRSTDDVTEYEGSGPGNPYGSGYGVQHQGLGISNTKVRLYVRESTTKWRDLGAARLTIAMPTLDDHDEDGDHDPDQGHHHPTAHDGRRHVARRQNTDGGDSEAVASGPANLNAGKRIIVTGVHRGEVLLDQVLGEAAFERVARTGIAVSVWLDHVGVNGSGGVKALGGVGAAEQRVYMLQMKSERECAYTFGLVGKQRY